MELVTSAPKNDDRRASSSDESFASYNQHELMTLSPCRQLTWNDFDSSLAVSSVSAGAT